MLELETSTDTLAIIVCLWRKRLLGHHLMDRSDMNLMAIKRKLLACCHGDMLNVWWLSRGERQQCKKLKGRQREYTEMMIDGEIMRQRYQ